EMPRAFSSFSRSVSTPVSLRTSAVLPWSMWPAVPTIMAPAPRRGGNTHACGWCGCDAARCPAPMGSGRAPQLARCALPGARPLLWQIVSRQSCGKSCVASRVSKARPQPAELGQEGWLIIEAPQVQDQRSLLHVAEHWDRQLAQRQVERLETAAGALVARRYDGDADAGQRGERQRARADLALAGSDLHTVGIAQRRSNGPAQPRRDLGHLRARAREVAHRRQGLDQPIRVAVELENGFECGQADLVQAQRRLHGVLSRERDELLAAGNDPDLWPAKQLVPGKGDEIGALGQTLTDRRLGL